LIRALRSPSIFCSIQVKISVYTVCGQAYPHHRRPPTAVNREQRVGRNDQQDGKEKHILRPEDHPEDVKLALDQIEQHRLPPVPGQPAQAVKISWVNQTSAQRQVAKMPLTARGCTFL
jgi:hypothetical protein